MCSALKFLFSFAAMKLAVPFHLALLSPDLSHQRRFSPPALEPLHDPLIARQLPDGSVPAGLQHGRQRAVGQPLAARCCHGGDQRLGGGERGGKGGNRGMGGKGGNSRVDGVCGSRRSDWLETRHDSFVL